MQPRYLLPLVVILVGVAAAAPATCKLWSGAPAAVAAGGLSLAAAVALHFNIRRYTTGADSRALDPGQAAEWWWSVAPSPLVVWAIGSLTFCALLTVLCVAARAEVKRHTKATMTFATPSAPGTRSNGPTTA